MKSTSLLLAIFLLFFSCTQAQTISGVVSDYFSKRPLDAVTIKTSSGHHSISDSMGRYSISVTGADSVWFSYLNKQTMKYPVDTITHPLNFDVALYVDARWLPEVKVRASDYRYDSIQNRLQYAKIFNFHKPGIKLSQSSPSTYVPGSLTVGFDLDEIINAFRFKRNRQLLSFQQRLIQDEQDKYIDHRYSKYLVKKLTQLDGKELEDFMIIYRPSYEEVLAMNDLELGYYIELCYKNYAFLKARGKQ